MANLLEEVVKILEKIVKILEEKYGEEKVVSEILEDEDGIGTYYSEIAFISVKGLDKDMERVVGRVGNALVYLQPFRDKNGEIKAFSIIVQHERKEEEEYPSGDVERFSATTLTDWIVSEKPMEVEVTYWKWCGEEEVEVWKTERRKTIPDKELFEKVRNLWQISQRRL